MITPGAKLAAMIALFGCAILLVATPTYASKRFYKASRMYYVAHKPMERICVVFHRRPAEAWTVVGTFLFFQGAADALKRLPECTK
jgi:hypothetical protein